MRHLHHALILFILIVCGASVPAQRGPAAPALVNPQVRAEFGARGLSSITAVGYTFRFPQDDFTISIDGRTVRMWSRSTPRRS